jgi:hypothetical protein
MDQRRENIRVVMLKLQQMRNEYLERAHYAKQLLCDLEAELKELEDV